MESVLPQKLRDLLTWSKARAISFSREPTRSHKISSVTFISTCHCVVEVIGNRHTIFKILWPRILWFADNGKFDLVELLPLDLGEVRESLLGFAERLILSCISACHPSYNEMLHTSLRGNMNGMPCTFAGSLSKWNTDIFFAESSSGHAAT